MNISDGATVVGVSGTIAVSGDADVVLDGAGSSWIMNVSGSSRGTLNVGKGDQKGSFASFPAPSLRTGTLTIQNGASVTVEESFIGTTRRGRGVLTVTGTGSLWSSGTQFTGNTFIGHEGDGELKVLDGGSVQTGQAFVGRFGLRDRLRGVANIDGNGSSWNSSSAIWVGFNNDPQVYNGAGLFFAEGEMNITAGGTVDAVSLGLAGRKVSKGVVNVSGAGSTMTAGSVSFGRAQTNTFTYGSNAEMTIADGGLLDVTGDIRIFHGLLTLDDGTINATNLQLHGEQLIDPATNSSETGDTRVTLTGNGQINANVINGGGFVEPGLAVGVISIANDYTQAADGTLSIEIGGADNSDPNTPQFDELLIDGLATLGGTLDVSLVDLGTGVFSPQAGDSFGFLSANGGFGGSFDTLNLPALSSGLQWLFNTDGSTLFLDVIGTQTADFDNDGDVDADDLAQWQGDFGLNGDSDADSDNDSDGADFLAWQRQFGSPGTSGSASSQIVPEPSSAGLLILGILGFRCRNS
jgi:T5SS/PEP-CTERM-associated repeat protein